MFLLDSILLFSILTVKPKTYILATGSRVILSQQQVNKEVVKYGRVLQDKDPNIYPIPEKNIIDRKWQQIVTPITNCTAYYELHTYMNTNYR